MKLKQMFLWQWKASRTAFLVFYIIVAAATMIGSIIFASQPAISGSGTIGVVINADNPSLGHFNMATLPFAAIFLFIAGLSSFSENLRVAFTNGVSRRTHYLGFIVFSVAAAIVTSLLSLLFDAIPSFFGVGAVSQFTGPFASRFLFFFAIYLFVTALGFFIAGAYYRMNNPARVLVSIGVPVLAIIFITNITAGRSVITGNPTPWEQIGLFFARLSDWLIDDLNASLFFVLLAALFFFFGWLLVRRAPVKAPAE